MLKHNRGKNITSGNLFLGILQFAIPLFLSTLVQNLFTAADTAIVGNFAGGGAVAAIGASNPVISLLVGGFVAFATGTGIVVAKYVGARAADSIKKTVDTAVLFAGVFGVALMVAAMLLSVPVLKLMKSPAECFDDAVLYLRIYMVGVPASMIYNFAAAIIRAEGDSSRPLVYIIISGIINVVTNVLLCLILPNKVAAVAIATVLSQVVSATLALARLMRKQDGFCRFSFKNVTFKFRSLGEMLRYGIPLAVATAIYPIANLQIQPAINSFGAANLAGNTAAISIDSVSGALQAGFNSTCVTFMAQNIGAHNKKRMIQAFWLSGLCSMLSGLVLGTLSGRVFSEELLGLFLPDYPEAVAWGQRRMQYTTANNWLSAILGWISASLQALGYPAFTTVNNLLCVLGFRIIWMNFVYPLNPVVDMLYICYLVSWSLTTVFGCVVLLVAFKKYNRKEHQYQLEHPIK